MNGRAFLGILTQKPARASFYSLLFIIIFTTMMSNLCFWFEGQISRTKLCHSVIVNLLQAILKAVDSQEGVN